jgi:hypothetical protein
MSMTSDLDSVRESINSGAIADLPAKRLEEFSVFLCKSQAFSHFGASEFPQICETVRTHLLRAHIETLQGHVTELHDHITTLNDSNTKLQKLVVVLTVASLIGTGAQVWFAAKADKTPEEKSPATASQLQPPTGQSVAPIQAAAPSSGQARKKAP